MSKCDTVVLGGAVAELREQLDADERFKKVLMGFDPKQVNESLKAQKEAYAQLQDLLTRECREAEERRRDTEARLAALAADRAGLAQALELREAQLRDVQARLDEAGVEMETLRGARARESEQLVRLRESVELQNLEHMRAQLIAITRESSENTALLAAARQENKQLKARLEALSADFEAASMALNEERERYQTRQLAVDRAIARIKARTHLGAAEATARLKSAADLIASCFAESESLLLQLEEVPSAAPLPPAEVRP